MADAQSEIYSCRTCKSRFVGKIAYNRHAASLSHIKRLGGHREKSPLIMHMPVMNTPSPENSPSKSPEPSIEPLQSKAPSLAPCRKPTHPAPVRSGVKRSIENKNKPAQIFVPDPSQAPSTLLTSSAPPAKKAKLHPSSDVVKVNAPSRRKTVVDYDEQIRFATEQRKRLFLEQKKVDEEKQRKITAQKYTQMKKEEKLLKDSLQKRPTPSDIPQLIPQIDIDCPMDLEENDENEFIKQFINLFNSMRRI